MSKMKCAEVIYDALVSKNGTVVDRDGLEDIFMACFALASGDSDETDIVKWIAAKDKQRSEEKIALDICKWFYRNNRTDEPSKIIARAIAAGRDAL